MNAPAHESSHASSAPATALVLGNGGFGTALALVLDRNGAVVRVWGHDPEYTRRIQETRSNPKFLPGVSLPPTIRFASSIEELTTGVEVVISAIPTQFLRASWERLAPSLPARAIVASCSKGFEKGTGARPTECVRAAMPRARLCVLSGPSHAEEIAVGMITSVVCASDDADAARRVQVLFNTPSFRVYTSTDPVGVEIAGAAKNVIALAAGILDGLGFGDNARAALLCRGASEISRLGAALGAEARTFAGLSGIGDLIATCTSAHSRNRAVGLRLAAGESLDDIVHSTEKIAEGVETTASLHELAARRGVELPITAEVYRILYEGKAPRLAVEDLMMRAPRDEF